MSDVAAPAAAAPRARGVLGAARAAVTRRRELVLHLAARQLSASHRRTALGWSWPLMLQLAQLVVLVFLFGKVLKLDIDDYPTYVFTGLVFWGWFTAGLTSAASSITDQAPLVLEPRMPRAVLPLVTLAVTAFDVLVALPVLLVMVGVTVGLSPWILFLPVLLLMQAVLMTGLALLVSALHVYVRDVKPLIQVGLLILFYLTPIFYDLQFVPDEFVRVYDFNPVATLITSYHAIFVYGRMPDVDGMIVLSLVSLAILALGATVFRRLSRAMVDEL